jgi:multidrug efflux pump subunit AcrA (membrane-fusion protein)
MSWKSVEAAQTQTEKDETKVADLKAALDTAKTNLASTEIVSPIDGTVVSRNVELARGSKRNLERRRSSSSPRIAPPFASRPRSALRTAARSSSGPKRRSPSQLFQIVSSLAR